MKILSIILLLSICACKTTKNSAGNSSQLKTETITIDFADLGKSTLKKKAAKGSLVQLEVKNFNRNQYTVAINNTQNNFFVTQPDIFKTLNPATLDVTEKKLE